MSVKQSSPVQTPVQITPPVSVRPNVYQMESFLAQREKEKEMVRGKFTYHELPGGQLDFMFKKYKGDELKKYELKDGGIYTIPLAVARHLNTNCSYPSYHYKDDQDGRPAVSIKEKVRRCSFQSLEFFDQDAKHTSGYAHSALPVA